jgi:hypothetical protein
MDKMIAYYVQRLKDHEDAYYSLLDIDESLLPDLINAYANTTDEKVRSEIIDIVGEHRRSDDIDFVATGLQSTMEEIWKSSLDALVKIGSKRCIEVLVRAKSATQSQERHEWYDEAIQQLEDHLAEENGSG